MLAPRRLLFVSASIVLVCRLASGGILQWDFDGSLSPSTAGADLLVEAAAPESVPTIEFLEDIIGGEEAEVVSFTRGTYFRMRNDYPPNGGGVYVNQYTLILDVMFPDTASSGWAALWQTSATNANDGDWFVRSGTGIGISGNYGGSVPDGEWHRLALVVDLVAGTFTSYVDGVRAMQNGGLELDGRFSLGVEALLFADEDSESSAGLINSVQIRDEALSADAIAALGGPTAEGIPFPSDPRSCEFRGLTVAYDAEANVVTGGWNLLPGDQGFRVLEGARQVGDLGPAATSFSDASPPVDGEAVVYTLQCLSGGGVSEECVSPQITTYACAADLVCSVDQNAKRATLSWKPAANTSATGYEIFRDGESIGTVGAGASSYADSASLAPGVHAYRVEPRGLAGSVCTDTMTCAAGVIGGDLLFFDDFDGYSSDADLAAAGWEVEEVNAPNETGAAWTVTNPGRRGNPPTPNGRPSTGRFLISDSDHSPGVDGQGSGMSHDILSPPFDARGKSAVWLHMGCSAMLNNNGEVVFDIDVSDDDGASWTNVFRRVAAARAVEPLPTADIPEGFEGGPQRGNTDGVYGTLHVDLSAVAAGEPTVRFRLRQFEPSDDWWIAVDDVRVDAVPAVGGARMLLETDFADGFPAGWDLDSAGDGLAPWSVADPCLVSLLNFNGGLFPDGADGRRLHYFDDAFAMVAQDEATCLPAVQDEWLLTPPVDCEDATMVFLHVRSSLLITRAVAEILLSVDGGVSFDADDPVFTYNASDDGLVRSPGNADVVHDEILLEVPEASGKREVVFAFHYRNEIPDSGFWAIDDVKVTADGGAVRPIFHRGDADDDGAMNITDGIFVLNWLFLGGSEPPCLEAADADNDGTVNITDGIYILNFLFLGGPPPASPGPPPDACGPDPDEPGSAGDIGCGSYGSC